jgi:DinB superfamily
MPRHRTRYSEPIHSLLRSLDQAYDHPAWHGVNLRGSIRGLTPSEALWRPGRRRHNIWEEVLHAAYWKYAVRRRLVGGKRGSFAESFPTTLALKGSNWFAAPASGGAKEWKETRALLDATHRALRAAVEQCPAARLGRPVTGSKWSALDSILGMALHDVYHAGQIQMLKRLHQSRA